MENIYTDFMFFQVFRRASFTPTKTCQRLAHADRASKGSEGTLFQLSLLGASGFGSSGELNMKFAVVQLAVCVCSLVTGGAVFAKKYSLKGASNGEECIPCDRLFTKIKATPGGRRIQYFEMQLRGKRWMGGAGLVTE